MDRLWNDILISQFSAAIDMLEKPIRSCPAELWKTDLWNDPDMPAGFAEFWYIAYHTLFWTDLYLTGKVEGFIPPSPFDLNELDPNGMLPANSFTKSELLVYLAHCREKCRHAVADLDDDRAHQVCEFPWVRGKLSYLELLLDNLRHIQEHGAQLNMLLGQHAGVHSKWIEHIENS
jgi:DinB superfamily